MVIADNHNKIMKIFLTFIVLFFSSSAFSETYHCVEKDAIGFDGKTYKNTNFNLIKFIAEIDFNRLLFEAADILLDTKLNAHNCYNNWKDSSMQCINGEGTSFSINKKNLNFVVSNGFGYVHDKNNEDDLFISYGKCSKL